MGAPLVSNAPAHQECCWQAPPGVGFPGQASQTSSKLLGGRVFAKFYRGFLGLALIVPTGVPLLSFLTIQGLGHVTHHRSAVRCALCSWLQITGPNWVAACAAPQQSGKVQAAWM